MSTLDSGRPSHVVSRSPWDCGSVPPPPPGKCGTWKDIHAGRRVTMEPTCPGLGPKWQPLRVGGHHEVWAGAGRGASGRGGGRDSPPEVPEK